MDVAFPHARFADAEGGTDIPGALGHVISAGVTIEPRVPIFGSVHVRRFGPRALVEDGSVKSAATTLWNGEVGYRLSSKARVIVEAFNLLNVQASAIDYFYTSRLRGEPAEGVADVQTHPAPPRMLRVGLQVSF